MVFKLNDIIILGNGKKYKLVTAEEYITTPKKDVHPLRYMKKDYNDNLECIFEDTTDYDIVTVIRDGQVIWQRDLSSIT